MRLNEKLRNLIEQNIVAFDREVYFTDDENIFELGFVNSLFAMKLVAFIEEELGVEIDNDDLDIFNFNTINNIISFMGRKNGTSLEIQQNRS